ncbi:MAG: GNAT family N-acetyltransferase [Nitrospinota bacterium]|nr:GNAT family N-acetyltransferase [Nitrospinota bacterium]
MPPIRAEWNTLAGQNPASSIFQTWEWTYYHMVYSGPNHRPVILTVRNGDRKLVGACPLFLRKTSLLKLIPVSILEFVGSGDSDYLGFLADIHEQEAVLQAIMGWITSSKLWSVVHLRSLTETEPLRRCLRRGTPRYKSKRLTDDLCPYIFLDRNWHSLEDGLSHSLQKYLKRKTNKLTNDKSWKISTVADEETINQRMADFMDLHNQRLRKKSLLGFFESDVQKNLFMQLTKSFAKNGWVRLITLDIDNKLAGALYTLRFKNKLLFYQSGIDPKYEKYSLGYLLHFHAVKTAWDYRLDEYDFLKGDENYKRQWANKTRKVYRLIIFSNSINRILYNLMFITDRFLLGAPVQKLYLFYKTTFKSKPSLSGAANP